MVNRQEAYNLIVKKLADEISETENEQLHEWLSTNPEHAKTFAEMKTIWSNAKPETLYVDRDKAWENVSSRIAPKVVHFNFKTAWRAAAVLLALSSLTLIVYNQLSRSTTTIRTAAKEIKQVDLPDGSKVWIHEQSSVTFNSKLNGSKREISLKGLAFFDVKRDESRPFIIETPQGSVEVLGTSFEVSAFEKDTFERVTVSTGKVKFSNNRSGKELLLTKDMQGLIGKSGVSETTNINAAELVTWQTNSLVFNNEPMSEVAEKISRYYHVEVRFHNDNIKDCRFTGTFNKATLQEVLNTIGKALNLTTDTKRNRVIFKGEGCTKTTGK